MTDLNSCRLCGYSKMSASVRLTAMPRWNHRLLQQNEIATDEAIDLSAYQCPSCGFVCVLKQLSDDYYDDYVNAPSVSMQAQRFQSDQAQEFVGRFNLSGRQVLEVGCGDGFFLQSMQNAGAVCTGVEPSKLQRELARSRGLKVESGVLSSGRKLADGPFDAFATRQVLEHVEDMRDFLLTIRGNLCSNAVGLVEVPNLDKLVEEGRFFDFIPEHINYFNPLSLGLVLQLTGFEVLDICSVQDGESLRALVRRASLPNCDSLVKRVASLRSDMAGFLAACEATGKKLAIWGAGGKGLSMMAVLDLGSIRLLVDKDPHKIGLFTPVSHLRVEHPRELAQQAIDVVVVMAPAYEREIVRELRDNLGFIGEIVLAGRGFEKLGRLGDVN